MLYVLWNSGELRSATTSHEIPCAPTHVGNQIHTKMPYSKRAPCTNDPESFGTTAVPWASHKQFPRPLPLRQTHCRHTMQSPFFSIHADSKSSGKRIWGSCISLFLFGMWLIGGNYPTVNICNKGMSQSIPTYCYSYR